MAIQIKHATTAVGTEAGDGEIGKTEWNEAHTLTLETGKLLGRTTAGSGAVEEVPLLDEDDMATDRATAVPTQQSVKAYVDAEVGAIPAASSGVVQYVMFTTSANFVKANYTDARAFEVICQGPGGDGIAADRTSIIGGAGGGAGGQAIKIFQPSDLAASVSMTIDATKAEFTHSTAVVANTGGDGSDDGNDSIAGSGGTATGGDLNFSGQDGMKGTDSASLPVQGGRGGSPVGLYALGSGGAGATAESTGSGNAGQNGAGYGGGGGGSASGTSTGSSSAGTGAPGVIIVKVYY